MMSFCCFFRHTFRIHDSFLSFVFFLFERTVIVALDINKDIHDGAARLREGGLFLGCDSPNCLNPLYAEICVLFWWLIIRI